MIGDRLRIFRERKHLTQRALEERTGLPRAYLSRVESGAANPSIDAVEKLAGALQVSVHQILHCEEEPLELPNLRNRLTAADIVWGKQKP